MSRIIQYVDLALKVLEIVYYKNRAAVEGIADQNRRKMKESDEGKRVGWRGAHTKGKGCQCELIKNMFFQNYLLQLCLKKKRKIIDFFPDTNLFYN